MTQYEHIADRIESGIEGMFHAVQTQYSQQFAYSLLFKPNRHSTWFVVLFSPTSDILKESFQDGTCYLLYRYLADNFSKDEVLMNSDIFISFEIGDRPMTAEGYDSLFGVLSDKMERVRNSNELSSQEICSECGHSFNEHQLMTFGKEVSEEAVEGWITCPTENCTCFKTWNSNYSGEKI